MTDLLNGLQTSSRAGMMSEVDQQNIDGLSDKT